MKYTIGIDFGTLSARGVLVNSVSGEVVAEASYEYPHAVMDSALPSGKTLPEGYALQHPLDYKEALVLITERLRSAVSADDIVGIGFDFTACTLLPIDERGEPLCLRDEFADDPHAYVKLWKHHGAEQYAREITELAESRGESWLSLFGGKISCEWAIPKILETLRSSRSVFDAAARFTEAGDYISYLLTGEHTAAISFAGYKWLYVSGEGFPTNDYFEALDPALSGIIGSKICDNVIFADGSAGKLSSTAAEMLGLREGIAVALPVIDAHAAMPALDVMREGELMLILGTSGCQILNAREKINIYGTAGYVYGGIIPGLATYEAGQASFGDNFDWFVRSSVPEEYTREARERGISVHTLLRERASKLAVGQSGLLALDWLNGNRSILVDPKLSGLVLGITLATKPEEIYRALIEAVVFGTKVILDTYEQAGIAIGKITAAGGIALKDEMMMQIYSDVLNKDIYVSARSQAGAYGSAEAAMAAAGIYESIERAAATLAVPAARVYHPIAGNVEKYAVLFAEYKRLHDYFGKENLLMHRLRAMKCE